MEDFAIYEVKQKATSVDKVIFLLEAIQIHFDLQNRSRNRHLVRAINTSTNAVTEWIEIEGANPFHDFAEKLKEEN